MALVESVYESNFQLKIWHSASDDFNGDSGVQGLYSSTRRRGGAKLAICPEERMFQLRVDATTPAFRKKLEVALQNTGREHMGRPRRVSPAPFKLKVVDIARSATTTRA